MAIPTYEQLMLPLLEILRNKNIYTNKECIDILAEKLNITEKELRELLPSGKRKFFMIE